jgi:hypothetical protein
MGMTTQHGERHGAWIGNYSIDMNKTWIRNSPLNYMYSGESNRAALLYEGKSNLKTLMRPHSSEKTIKQKITH